MKAKIEEEMNTATSVALTTDIWTSCQTKSYCCVTAHLINGDWELKSYLLETFHFCLDHTPANISMELQQVVESWNIQDKIVCVVTDNAANMVAAISSTRWRHLPCFAHSLNLVVQNSIKSDPELFAVQTKCKNVVSHFHRSVKSIEKLGEIQRQLSLPEHKLIQDVSTRWNSTYIMLERFYEQFEAITTTLCLVNKNDLCLKADEKDTISRALQLLKPFLEATENISGQAYVSISMIVPLTKILQQHCSSLYRANPSSVLAGSLNSELNNRFTSIETHYVTAVSTLLDPRFKKISFADKTALSHTINRITQELQTVVPEPSINSTDQDSRSPDMEEASTDSIWNSFDQKAKESQIHRTSTVEATIEVRRYFEEAVISRNKDPLEWWKENSCRFPLLKVLARRYLCIPGSSVPSERLFSQAGVLVSERRNRISPKNVDIILFLNQNL